MSFDEEAEEEAADIIDSEDELDTDVVPDTLHTMDGQTDYTALTPEAQAVIDAAEQEKENPVNLSTGM